MSDDAVGAPAVVGEVVANDQPALPAPTRKGCFVKGDPRINYSGNNRNGRKSGAKNRLSNAFVLDLIKWHSRHGYKAIEKVGREKPEVLLQICAAVSQREVKVDVEHRGGVAVGVVDLQGIKERTRELFARISNAMDSGSRED